MRLWCQTWRFSPALAIAILVMAGGMASAGPTSENSARLRKVLERFPQSDANRDGVLSLEEARRFRERRQTERQAPRGGTASGMEVTKDVAYGPHARNVLDVYVPEGTGDSAPLIVYIHGGGFIDGDKSVVSPEMLRLSVEHGVAVASINYRFITADAFPAPLHDCARAVQYLRANAQCFGIDAKRFAVYGNSAGGGASLWLALHDDLADAASEDPVLRESTRVCVAGAIRGQTTYSPPELREWLGDIVLQHRSVLPLYGAKAVQELLEPTAGMRALFEECSPIHHASADDPPLVLFYTENTPPTVGGAIHSRVFGEKLKARLDAAGVAVVLHTDQREIDESAVIKQLFDFFWKVLRRPGR